MVGSYSVVCIYTGRVCRLVDGQRGAGLQADAASRQHHLGEGQVVEACSSGGAHLRRPDQDERAGQAD